MTEKLILLFVSIGAGTIMYFAGTFIDSIDNSIKQAKDRRTKL